MFITTEKLYFLALSLVPGIGCSWLKKLLTHFGSAEAVFVAVAKGGSGVPAKMAQYIANAHLLIEADQLMRSHEKVGIYMLTMKEAAYPKRLLELPDAPAILYGKGACLLNPQRVVGIVGTRQLSAYGQRVLTAFLEQLLPYQPLVVSGLAYGTDVWVHKRALAVGLPTVAVLPTSLDRIYPAVHTSIAMEMCKKQGGLLTEYPIGSKLGAYSFVARNRIVAGLVDAIIVIEAKIKSGALITAYYANGYHREVFALPGDIYAATSEGCHQLIKRNQAHLISHIDDLAYMMNWKAMDGNHQKKDIYATYALTPSEHMLLRQFQQTTEAIAIDTLLATTVLSPGELQAALLALELQGLLRALPGKYFVLACKEGAE